MKGSGIIIRKELKRVFGDRKLVFSLFILPAILVVVIYSLMGVLISSMQKDIAEHTPVTYIVNATDDIKVAVAAQGFDQNADITYLSESQYAAQKSEIEDGMLNGVVDLIVVQDPKFDMKVAAYSKAGDEIPELKIYFNSAENYSTQAYGEFSKVVDAYRTMLLAERVGNLEMLNVFTQNDEVIVKEEKANSQFISMMLPYLITMMLFAGAMSVGVDAIAGEKERGTLASMLLSPVSRNEIVVGKLVSMALLSGLSAIVYAVAMMIAMPMMGGAMGDMAEEGFGGLSFGIVQALQLLVIMLVMVYLYVAIIGLLAVIAKDVKTASTYISPVYIVVILAGMMTMFNSGKDRPIYHYMIPVYGNALAIGDLCGNELTTPNFIACLAGSAIVAVILTAAVTRAFNSEKIMFNA